MKKLLSLLSIITISGSGMTGIIGNAPILTKNKINYLQTNNLKLLNKRQKRDYDYLSKKLSLQLQTE